jgi:Golgi nucleoside diphosphatase
MYFYRWDVPRDRGTGDIEEIHSCNSSRSLNSYASDPSQAGTLTKECIDDSKNPYVIPKNQWTNTHLYLGATAGMRLINRSNHSLSEQIFASVNKSLAHSGYNLSSGRIITGQEEAVAGWIAGNFLSRGLEQSGSSLTGTLDLGGASVEIAFQHPSAEPSEYQASVTLFETNHSLYARSYLCYGLNEARFRLLAHLINESSAENKVVENPCMLKNATITFHDEIFTSGCVNHSSSDIFGFGFSPPPHPSLSSQTKNYTFIGTGDYSQCTEIVEDVFDLTNCSDPTVCHNHSYFWPPVNNSGTFLGMAGFYETANFFNNSGMDLHDLTNFSLTVQSFCQLNNSNASQKYLNNSYLQELCFNGVFSLFLLETGFGFNDSNTDWTLKFVDKVEGTTVTWAMGYLVQQTTTIPDNPYDIQRPFKAVDLVVGIIILSTLCVVFVIFFFLTFHACRKVLKTRGGYSHIS